MLSLDLDQLRFDAGEVVTRLCLEPLEGCDRLCETLRDVALEARLNGVHLLEGDLRVFAELSETLGEFCAHRTELFSHVSPESVEL